MDPQDYVLPADPTQDAASEQPRRSPMLDASSSAGWAHDTGGADLIGSLALDVQAPRLVRSLDVQFAEAESRARGLPESGLSPVGSACGGGRS
jgi:hypothetical protein